MLPETCDFSISFSNYLWFTSLCFVLFDYLPNSSVCLFWIWSIWNAIPTQWNAVTSVSLSFHLLLLLRCVIVVNVEISIFIFFLLFNTPFYGLFQLPDVIKLCNNAPYGFILFLTVIVQHDSKVKVTIRNKSSEDEKLHQWMHVLEWIQVWYCLNFLCKLS